MFATLMKLNDFSACCVQIARVMGNALLNEVLEANLTDAKITPDASTYVTLSNFKAFQHCYDLLYTASKGKSIL